MYVSLLVWLFLAILGYAHAAGYIVSSCSFCALYCYDCTRTGNAWCTDSPWSVNTYCCSASNGYTSCTGSANCCDTVFQLGLYLGIAAGIVAFFIILGAVVWCLCRCRYGGNYVQNGGFDEVVEVHHYETIPTAPIIQTTAVSYGAVAQTGYQSPIQPYSATQPATTGYQAPPVQPTY